jgi:hypothetical protein
MRYGVLFLSVAGGCTSRASDIRYVEPAGLEPLQDREETEGSESWTDPDEPTGTDSTATTTDDTSTSTTDTGATTTTSGVVEACYPGADGSYATCLEVVELSPTPADYVYPPPLSGSAQYAAPVRYLVLADHATDLQLAANFVMDEVAQEYKGDYAVVQPHAIQRLQDLRDVLGPLIVNSGYRNPAYNASVGGASSSRHMYGDAFDLDPVNVTLDELEDACYAHGASYVGVYTTHRHCDWRDDPLDAAFYGGTRSAPLVTEQPVHDAWIERIGAVLEAPAEGWDCGEPLREWTAYDADGNVIEAVTAASYLPPPDAVEVEVVVGRAVTTSIEI